MALSANTVLECRVSGSDTNGGGFVAGASGTDWSQQDSAQYSVTDGVTAGTTTITSATANFGADVVGNLIYVQGGTGSVTAGWYQIVSRTNSTTIVVDRSTGLTAGTGVTLKIGGALASPGQAGAIKATISNGCKVFLKYNASAFSLTNTTQNTSGGPVLDSTGASGTLTGWCGYDTTRSWYNTDANRPTVTAGSQTGLTNGLFQFTGSFVAQSMSNIIVNANSGSTNKGITTGSSCRLTAWRVDSNNSVSGAWSLQGVLNFIGCSSTGCSTTAAFNLTAVSSGSLLACRSFANTVTGFGGDGVVSFEHCLSYGNTGGSSLGFFSGGGSNESGWTFLNCIAYGNGSDGFSWANSSARAQRAVNCLSTGNGGYGFNSLSTNTTALMYNCATHNNTSGATNNVSTAVGAVALSGDPFTNAGSGDFSLNNTAGAGAACRAAGYPGAFPGGLTTGYLDIGAAQHQDAGGSAGARLVGASALVTPGALVC